MSCNSSLIYVSGVPSRSIPATGNAAAVQAALETIPALTNVKVSFSQVHGTACQMQSNIISIEFVEQFGSLNPLVALPDSVMSISGGSVTVVTGGVSVTDAMGTVVKSVAGTKEADLCANRGLCDTTSGVCSCFVSHGDVYGSSDGYGRAGTRGDCGHVQSSSSNSVSDCPGELPCSGHGVCAQDTKRCACSDGWQGGDCSEMSCPLGLSWFSYPTADEQAHFDYAVCANMGHCDTTTGRCMCRKGFYGEACEYMACDGVSSDTESSLSKSCNGHGRCMSMAELALWANDNGDATDYVYGSDPNNPLTWDKDRVHGCLCDPGFSGYDCSLVDCPGGDDPGTYDDHVEVQFLQCVATAGNFTLSFRQQETALMSFNVTADIVQAELAKLSTVGDVRVYFTYDGLAPDGTLNNVPPGKTMPAGAPEWGHFDKNQNNQFVEKDPPPTRKLPNTSFCTVDGTQIAIISFEYTHGDLPALKPKTVNLLDYANFNGELSSGKINVFTDGASVFGLVSIKGTTETAVCNGRGLCDTTRGECHCFDDWTSSDGARQGGPGFTGDCGYRNDLKYSFFDSLQQRSNV
jgi:hypothetical protein